jgi:hypothetical protein
MIQLWVHILPITENVQLENLERIELILMQFDYITMLCFWMK